MSSTNNLRSALKKDDAASVAASVAASTIPYESDGEPDYFKGIWEQVDAMDATDHAYSKVSAPIEKRKIDFLRTAWEHKKKRDQSVPCDFAIRMLMVQILGNRRKQQILEEILVRMRTTYREADLFIPIFRYEDVVVKSPPPGARPYAVPPSVLQRGRLQGWSGEKTIHQMMIHTDLLNRIEAALDPFHFVVKLRRSLKEDTQEYSIYTTTLYLFYYPNGVPTFFIGRHL